MGSFGAKLVRQITRGALVAAGVALGAGGLLAQEGGSRSILPQYPTSKQQVVAQQSLEVGGAQQATTLKWRNAVRPLPQRSAALPQGEVQPASMNLRVGSASEAGVEPAIALTPAETIIAQSPDFAVQPAQARSRFESQPSLDPPGRLPNIPAPAEDATPEIEDDLPAVTDPLFQRPLTGNPELDVPAETPSTDLPPATTEPVPSELPPLTNERLQDPGAARDDFGASLEDKREEMPCRENYRDTNCCEQNADCANAWGLLERNPVRLFQKDFLDITPLYRPDVRYSGKEAVDQEKARAEGLALGALRTWKNVNGKPLGLSADGTVLGLDGEDWLGEWERASREAELEIGGIRTPRPAELKGRVQNYKRGASQVTIATEAGDNVTLDVNQLSLDDNEWLKGRPWRDAEGRLLARGRFHDFEWNRILVQEDSGRIVVVPYNKLGDDDLCYVGAYWGEGVGLPAECRLRGEMRIRNFTMLTYTWKASGLCHKPLYFEEVQLERYGHTFGPVAQPFVSGAHFFANIAILPYKMGINPPYECQYSLGYYRPGDCAPYMIPPVPLSLRAATVQAGAVTGAVALFP